MKVLLLIDSLGSGGAQRQIVTLSCLLKEKGYDVSLVTYHKDDFFKGHLDEMQISVHLIQAKNYLARIFKIRKFIRSGKFDAVISFLEVPGLLNCIAAIGGKTWKVITSERSSKESAFNSMRGRIFAWFQRYSDAIICNSYNAKNIWIKYYPQYSDKLKVIYNPVILPPINTTYIPKKDGRLQVIIAASYQYLKNPLGLINALALLNDQDRKKIEINWYGRKEVIPGNSEAYDQSCELIHKHKLDDIIKLNGPTKDIAAKMNSADIVALFSELEGMPNAICEGMMIGKPVIMTKVSDYEKLVTENNGILCDWNNDMSIKDALLNSMKLSTDELTNMGYYSKIRANELFSPQQILNKWLKLLNS